MLLAACRQTPDAEPMDTVVAVDTGFAVIDTPWVVTPARFGPLHFGTHIAVASAAIGDSVTPRMEIPGSTCGYATPGTLPAGTSLMVVDDTVVRIDVVRGQTATAEGARIGDPADRIHTLYAGRLRVEPHKYTDGQYLIAHSGSRDTSFAIVFETDDSRVARYRAGRVPQVLWVEGCH